MDDIQTYLKHATSQIIDALDDRQRLKSLLSDCLSGNKLQLNLLLNAYDNDVPVKLQNSATVPDKNLFLQGLVQSLTSDYGITEQAALWAIESWCLILGVSLLPSAPQSNVATVDDSVDVVVSQFESFLASSLKSSTVKNYILEVRKFIDHECIIHIDDITCDDVNDYIENGTEGYSSITSLKRRRSILEKLLKFLADRGFVQSYLLSECGMDYQSANSAHVANTAAQPQGTIASPIIKPLPSASVAQPINALLNNASPQQSPISGVPMSVLNKLLEDDDYIDYSLSLQDTYYVIRSPSNEKKAGITFDGLRINKSDNSEYAFLLDVPRNMAKKKIKIIGYLYLNTGAYIDSDSAYPDFDHYKLWFYSYNFPNNKFTKPFFIRLRFAVD